MMVISVFFLLVLIPHAASITFNLPSITQQNLNRDIVVAGDAYLSNDGIQLTPYETDSDSYPTGAGRAIGAIPYPKDKAGRATYVNLLHLWDKASGELASFDTSFSFIIADISDRNTYAEGLTFFLAENNSVITYGGAIGLPVDPTTYDMESPFVAVEFDTNQNSLSSDPTYENHVGIDLNSVRYQLWDTDITGGLEYMARVRYDSVIQTLYVSVSEATAGSVLQLYYKIDLRTILPEWVIFGFTASTGDYVERNTVKSWRFNSSNLHVDEKKAPPPTPSEDRVKGKNRTGLMVGSIAAGLVFVLAVLAIFPIYLRRSKKNKIDEGKEGEIDNSPEPVS